MTLIKIEFRTLLKSFLIWSILFLGIILIFTAFYPQIADEQMKDSLDTVMQNFSPELLKAFNLNESLSTSLTTAIGFFAYYFQYLFLASAIYAMLLGASALIKEETDGTIEFVYAQPISRIEIVSSKFISNLVVLFSFWVLSYGAALLGLALFKQESDQMSNIIEKVSKIFLSEFVVLFFFLALGFFISTILKSSKQGTGVSLGVVFGFYLLGIFSDLSDNFSFLQNFSPIHMGMPSRIIEEELKNGWLLLVVGSFFLTGSLFVYNRKDLKV